MNVEINNPLKNPTLDKYLEERRDLKPGSEDFMQCMNVIAREIALEGKANGVPFEHTYSCYEGRHKHCGDCATCRERKEALAGFDPTEYEL